jgi:hypothetical protein
MGRLRAATAASTGGFDRRLRPGALTDGFELRRRLRAAAAALTGGG